MKITLYCIGKLKESYWRMAQDEYAKRLNGYCDFQIVELPDLPTPEGASPATEAAIKEKECKRILEKLKPGDYLVAMDLNKKEYDSVSFSTHLEDLMRRGGSSVNFAIGGSLGLSDELKARANESISFGKMTFPHQLSRVMLLEQLYRAYKISKHEPYHK